MATALATTTRRKREKGTPFEGTPPSPPVDQHKGKVWNYYTKLRGTCVECNVCRKQLSIHNSTTTLREHLLKWHSSCTPKIAEEHEQDFPSQEVAPKRLKQTPPGKESCPSDSESRTGVIADLVLEMVCRDLHPLSVVEGKGFGLLLEYFEPSVNLPSSTQLSGLLCHRYNVMKQQLRCHLQDSKAIVLSMESWSSCLNHPCQAITANVIDGEWNLAQYMLGSQELHTGKTEDCLVERLCSVVGEYDLSRNHVSCVMHDQLASMLAHADTLKDTHGWTSVCCAAHVLQLCVREGLEIQDVKEVLSAARGLVSYLQQDLPASTYLSARLESMNKARPVMDTESCWITTLHMCQSLLNIKWAILSVMEDQLVQNLSKQHWNLLQDLVSVLKIVWIATIFLQEEQNTSMSSVIPCVHGILNAFTHFSENSSSIGKAFVNQIRVEMCRHWDMVNEANLLASPAVVATFFDPRYKELRFLKPEARGEVFSKVISLLSQTCDTQPGLLLDSGVEETFDQCLQRDTCSRVMHDNLYDLLLGKDPTEIMPEARQQLESYIAEPVCKRSTDPLVWWKNNHHRFPELARLAQQYVIIPSTAIQPERAFSAKQGTMEQRRVFLEQNHMDLLLFVHHNMDLLDLPKKQ